MMTKHSIITLGDNICPVVPSKRYLDPNISQAESLLGTRQWYANHFSN